MSPTREFPTIGGQKATSARYIELLVPDTVSVCPLLLRAAVESISDIIVLMSRSLAIASKRIIRIYYPIDRIVRRDGRRAASSVA